MKQFLLEEFHKRPQMVLEDCVKLLFQRFFGPGHLISSRQAALSRLENEISGLSEGTDEPVFEMLGNGFCRLNLRPALRLGLSVQTLSAMFFQSARELPEAKPAFSEALSLLEDMIFQGLLPFSPEASREFLQAYRLSGCPAISHSEAYRSAYHPAYRVVDEICVRFLPLFQCIDTLSPARVAIDGRCGSGKSTLAAFLSAVYDAPIVHADDFFLQPHQRTPERMAEIGGNMDRERLLLEVLEPLMRGDNVVFRPFSCARQAIGEPISLPASRMTIIEGSYCMHPDLRHAYDLKVFLSVDPDIQRQRILQRNGEQMLRRFVAEWIPREEKYFDTFGVRDACDLIFA